MLHPKIFIAVELDELQLDNGFKSQILFLDSPKSSNEELYKLSGDAYLLESFKTHLNALGNFFTIKDLVDWTDIFHDIFWDKLGMSHQFIRQLTYTPKIKQNILRWFGYILVMVDEELSLEFTNILSRWIFTIE